MILVLALGCGTSPESTTQPIKTLQPVLVGSWSGQGTQNTELITIESAPWQITWSFSPNPPTFGVYANYFSITVQKPSDSSFMELIGNFANVSEPQTGKSFVHSSGQFYLSISALGGDWSINAYDNR